jgi:hypothetical protein
MVFNELAYAEEILKNGYKNKKYISYDNIILVKYWKCKGLSEEKIKENLRKFMSDFQELFDDNIINYKIHKAITIGMMFDLEVNKEIYVYQGELDAINSIENEDIRKILFILLVVWKYKGCHKFRMTNKDILKLAGV